MKIKASVLPLVVAMALAVVSFGMPWMTSNHYVDVPEQGKQIADNYVFYLWGQTYTVVGVKLTQSVTDVYDYRDFPFYGMIMTIIALALGAIAFLGGRGTVLHIRGREIKFAYKIDPVWLLMISSALFFLAWTYMQTASVDVKDLLARKGYVNQLGPALDFMFSAFLAMVVTTVMTYIRSRKDMKHLEDAGSNKKGTNGKELSAKELQELIS